MTTVLDHCSLVRSKNAGPFTLTLDFMCHDRATYDALVATGFLNPSLFASLYGTDPDRILVVNHPLALAVKVSLPRPMAQGALHDADCYAGQQYPRSWTCQSPECRGAVGRCVRFGASRLVGEAPWTPGTGTPTRAPCWPASRPASSWCAPAAPGAPWSCRGPEGPNSATP
ncbi:DUF4387 domain-containing protein [Streptomyces sp. NBC_01003]|uniref:DUF4387 domain-containing protein n=1 Tax=Streptomyces sp. NBC_01003 TaxID=2903714 RepID=UPI00386A555C|nr:DUF4387 domain-containing protein [Streptomyces sp. NBC_01003]